MSAATSARNTPTRLGDELSLPVAAATIIYQGTLAALNSDGNMVPADDAAALRVIGRAEATVDNSAGLAGDLLVTIRRGVFLYDNSGTAAVDADDKGKLCFVEDDQTVAETSTHLVKAGRVVDVVSEGVWVDTRYAHDVPSADTLTALTFTGGGATGPEVEALRDAVLAILQAQALSK